MLRPALATSKLLYWLAPVGAEARHPRQLRVSAHVLPPTEGYRREIHVQAYAPAGRPLGRVLVVHGLHPRGPLDPRMDRFCRQLAGGGLEVWAPALPEYLALQLDPEVVPALARVAQAFAREGPRFAVFSISFGSLPALRLIASSEFRGSIGGAVIFGGYADFRETMRFALGSDGQPRDPLNPPAIFINLAPHMEGVPARLERVLEAWREFALRTWGKPEMRLDRAFVAVAETLAATLDERERELFLLGCGLREGGLVQAEAALDRVAERFVHLDPRPHLASVHCPVTIVHGAGDDVIPWQQADLIAAALPPTINVRRYITGMYGHTGARSAGPVGLVREATKLVAMLHSLATYASG